jgi:predicted double-glycine peptidase
MRWTISIGLLGLAGLVDAKDSAPVRSLLEMRQQNVVVQQWDTSCGAAALATLLRYQHGLDAAEKEIADRCCGPAMRSR